MCMNICVCVGGYQPEVLKELLAGKSMDDILTERAKEDKLARLHGKQASDAVDAEGAEAAPAPASAPTTTA